MQATPIKFRCYKCNQLLGVAPTRAGTVVACPKCAANLRVPEPTEESSASSLPTVVGNGPTSPRPSSQPLEIDELISVIRPEDIRVEPGISLDRSDRLSSPSWPVDPSAPSEPDSPTDLLLLKISTTEPPPAPVPASAPPPIPIVPPDEPVPDVALPPIRLDQPKTIIERAPTAAARPRDIVLPRSVVLTWSLFVLLALALAFAAGLLAGHFVWKEHASVPARP
jgi:phage FluMu protein Com